MPNGAKRRCLAAWLGQRPYMWHQWETEKTAAGCMMAGQSSGSRRPKRQGMGLGGRGKGGGGARPRAASEGRAGGCPKDERRSDEEER
ncbi:hypothetical protein CDEST_14089 [Colletotrichum destructivum]|uniref:Uncharacterized protein n=1 Tax=Colletotrichum destructivum TaxID=34406 RepID=A0AAX4J100_9PEZI|nr:hypothetical protein CDEST_14089 [Colletotrichum destructivum]